MSTDDNIVYSGERGLLWEGNASGREEEKEDGLASTEGRDDGDFAVSSQLHILLVSDISEVVFWATVEEDKRLINCQDTELLDVRKEGEGLAEDPLLQLSVSDRRGESHLKEPSHPPGWNRLGSRPCRAILGPWQRRAPLPGHRPS